MKELTWREWLDRREESIKQIGKPGMNEAEVIARGLATISNILVQIAIELHMKFRPKVK